MPLVHGVTKEAAFVFDAFGFELGLVGAFGFLLGFFDGLALTFGLPALSVIVRRHLCRHVGLKPKLHSRLMRAGAIMAYFISQYG